MGYLNLKALNDVGRGIKRYRHRQLDMSDDGWDPESVLADLGITGTEKGSFNLNRDTDTKGLIDKYLTPSDQLPWSLLDQFSGKPNVSDEKESELNASLLKLPDLLNRTTIRFKRSGINGDVVSSSEDFAIDLTENSSSQSSLSFNRKFTGDSKLNVKGSTANLPFLPGGLDSTDNTNTSQNNAVKYLHKDKYGLYDIPQGFSRGLRAFDGADDDNDDDSNEADLQILKNTQSDEMNILAEELDDNSNDDIMNTESENNEDSASSVDDNDDEMDTEISQLIPKDTIIRPSTVSGTLLNQQKRKTNWAHVVDLNHKIENFDEIIPNPARTWPFELDIFHVKM